MKACGTQGNFLEHMEAWGHMDAWRYMEVWGARGSLCCTWKLGGHMEAWGALGSFWGTWRLVGHTQAWGPHRNLEAQSNGGYNEAWGAHKSLPVNWWYRLCECENLPKMCLLGPENRRMLGFALNKCVEAGNFDRRNIYI